MRPGIGTAVPREARGVGAVAVPVREARIEDGEEVAPEGGRRGNGAAERRLLGGRDNRDREYAGVDAVERAARDESVRVSREGDRIGAEAFEEGLVGTVAGRFDFAGAERAYYGMVRRLSEALA